VENLKHLQLLLGCDENSYNFLLLEHRYTLNYLISLLGYKQIKLYSDVAKTQGYHKLFYVIPIIQGKAKYLLPLNNITPILVPDNYPRWQKCLF
jgi:hypothetical protein